MSIVSAYAPVGWAPSLLQEALQSIYVRSARRDAMFSAAHSELVLGMLDDRPRQSLVRSALQILHEANDEAAGFGPVLVAHDNALQEMLQEVRSRGALTSRLEQRIRVAFAKALLILHEVGSAETAWRLSLEQCSRNLRTFHGSLGATRHELEELSAALDQL